MKGFSHSWECVREKNTEALAITKTLTAEGKCIKASKRKCKLFFFLQDLGVGKGFLNKSQKALGGFGDGIINHEHTV